MTKNIEASTKTIYNDILRLHDDFGVPVVYDAKRWGYYITEEYKVFQMFHGEQVKVRVRFSNHLADAVIDQFGKNTILVPEDDKRFIVLLPVELSPPLRTSGFFSSFRSSSSV